MDATPSSMHHFSFSEYSISQMFAKSLVSADRCALFLVDTEAEELYADQFDDGLDRDGKPVFVKRSQIRSEIFLSIILYTESIKIKCCVFFFFFFWGGGYFAHNSWATPVLGLKSNVFFSLNISNQNLLCKLFM